MGLPEKSVVISVPHTDPKRHSALQGPAQDMATHEKTERSSNLWSTTWNYTENKAVHDCMFTLLREHIPGWSAFPLTPAHQGPAAATSSQKTWQMLGTVIL